MSRHHDLKILPVYMDRIMSGEKRFEIRKNDRDFQAGDTFNLLEGYPGAQSHMWNATGRVYFGTITYVTNYEQKDGYVVFSFDPGRE